MYFSNLVDIEISYNFTFLHFFVIFQTNGDMLGWICWCILKHFIVLRFSFFQISSLKKVLGQKCILAILWTLKFPTVFCYLWNQRRYAWFNLRVSF